MSYTYSTPQYLQYSPCPFPLANSKSQSPIDSTNQGVDQYSENSYLKADLIKKPRKLLFGILDNSFFLVLCYVQSEVSYAHIFLNTIKALFSLVTIL